MIKSVFIRERNDKRELPFLRDKSAIYILVEGKNDKLLYSKYYNNQHSRKTKHIVEFKDCTGITYLHKILTDKREIKGFKNYYAIVDRDSRKYWASTLDINIFNKDYCLNVEGYCLENCFFLDYNFENLINTVRRFVNIKHDKIDYYFTDLIELLKEFSYEYSEPSNFTKISAFDYYERHPIKHVNFINNAETTNIQIIPDLTKVKYFDSIPISFNDYHGKDLLLAFTMIIKHLDSKYRNLSSNIFSNTGVILDCPSQLVDHINGFKIKTLDRFLKRVISLK